MVVILAKIFSSENLFSRWLNITNIDVRSIRNFRVQQSFPSVLY